VRDKVPHPTQNKQVKLTSKSRSQMSLSLHFKYSPHGGKKFQIKTVDPNKKLKSLCFFQQSTTPRRLIGEWRYSSTHSLISALDEGERSASRPSRFTPREMAPGTHWIGGWVGLRARLDVVVKRKIPSPFLNSNPRSSSPQPSAIALSCPGFRHNGNLPLPYIHPTVREAKRSHD
jgi:hypothetical protein